MVNAPSKLSLLALSSLTLSLSGGCIAELGSTDDVPASQEALVSECALSAYNCKLPAAKVDRNRIYNYATQSYEWPIAAGTPLLDGLGNARGNVAEKSVRINFGARKNIGSKAHVYAFAVKLSTGVTASGWVREGALAQGPITRMPTVKGKNPGEGDYEATWTVTGGDPNAFGDLKVSSDYDDGGRNATDYLKRPGDVVNLLYNLPGMGGVSIDTFPAGVKFHRSKGVLEIDVPLYPPGSTHVARRMKFIYGHIGGRYGWIARDALVQDPKASTGAPPSEEPPPPPAEGGEPPPPNASLGQCYVRCCDGSLHGLSTTDAPACHDASQPLCDGRGYVKRSEFNGAEVYERAKFCYAKCKNRVDYHRVDGVTQDCTEHAKAYCAVGDRGGLADAMWSQCDP